MKYAYLIFETIALICAFVQFKAIKNTIYKYFPVYLLLIVLYELGTTKNLFLINGSNLWITNITMTMSFVFYVYVLLKLLKSPQYIKRIKIVTWLILAFTVLNAALLQGFWKLDTISVLLQFALIIVTVCLFFYELINSFDFSDSIITLPAFWLNTGLLFFCLSEFLFFTSFAYMAYSKNYDYYILFKVIVNIANAILYSCYSITFICLGKTRKLYF